MDPLAPGNIVYLLWMVHRLPAGHGGPGGAARPAGRHVRPGAHVQPRVRDLRRGVAGAVAGPVHRRRRGDLADRCWRLVQAVGGSMLMANSAAILTDAFPLERARDGAGDQPDRGDIRAVPRAGRRWAARGGGLAGGVLGQRADRDRRHAVVLPTACATTACAVRPGSTGPATRRSPSGSAWCWSRSRTASSRTAAAPPGGATRWCSAGCSAGLGLLAALRRDRDANPASPCSGSALFRIRAFAAGTAPRCSWRSPAAGCSSC